MRAAKNPASLHTRQPGINQRRLSLSVSAALDRACVRTVGIGTTHLRAGCRGFIGPVPLPLVIRGYYFCIRYATTNQAVRQGLLHLFCTFFGKNHDKNVRSLAFAAEIRYTIQAVAMTTGSCAICRCEPCQGREAAAISAGRMCCGVAQSERRYLLLEYQWTGCMGKCSLLFLSARDCEMVDGEQSKKRRESIVSVRYVCYTDHRAEAQKSWEV